MTGLLTNDRQKNKDEFARITSFNDKRTSTSIVSEKFGGSGLIDVPDFFIIFKPPIKNANPIKEPKRKYNSIDPFELPVLP